MALVRFQLGEMKSASELVKLGFPFKGTSRYMWVSCPDCGKERWTDIRPSQRIIPQDNPSLRCRSCSSKYNWRSGALKYWEHAKEKNPMWKGGRCKAGSGYLKVRLEADDFFYPMVGSNGYVLEHRLIMAKLLGRCLQSWERVHHKNGLKDDNKKENLELTDNIGNHALQHSKGYQDGYLKGQLDGHDKAIKDLQSRVTLLEAENVLLKSQMAKEGVI